MAITWRSLMGQNTDPVRAMGAAQDSFNSMFGSLTGALTQYQQQQQAQETKLKSDNLERFYAEASSKYSTPEAFQAALASGELQSLAGSYGDAIDKAAVRNFMESRGKVLQDRALEQAKYGDAVRDRNEAGDLDEIKGLIAAGRFEEAKQRLDQGKYRNESPLYESLKTAQTQATEEAYKASLRPLELESKRLGLTASQESIENGRVSRGINQANLDNVRDQRMVDDALSRAYLDAQGTMMQDGLPNESAMTTAAQAITQNMEPRLAAKVLQQARQADVANVQAWRDDQDKNGYVGAVPLNPTAVSASLEDVIKTIPEGDQESVRSRVNKLVRDGVTIPKGTKLPNGETLKDDMNIPVPFNVARSAILESTSNLIGFRRGADAVSIIEEQVKRPEVFMDILTRDRAEKLKEALRENPDLPSTTQRKK